MDENTITDVDQVRDVLRPDELPEGFAYRMLTGCVLPRPIAWVSTKSAAGVVNLAPFSFFTVASRSPGAVVFSVGPTPDGGIKDSLANVRATGEFVVNIAPPSSMTSVHATGFAYPPDVDEFQACNIADRPSLAVSPPSVADALVSLECRLMQEVAVGSDCLVIGEVVLATAAPGHYRERLHVETSQVLGRMSGPRYVTDMRIESPTSTK